MQDLCQALVIADSHDVRDHKQSIICNLVMHELERRPGIQPRLQDSFTNSAERETIALLCSTMGNPVPSTCDCATTTVSTRRRALVAGARKTRLK